MFTYIIEDGKTGDMLRRANRRLIEFGDPETAQEWCANTYKKLCVIHQAKRGLHDSFKSAFKPIVVNN